MTTQPIAIFATLVGSLPRRACAAQTMSRSGTTSKIMNGLNDWNQVDGIVKPRTSASVLSSAQSCSVLPCCS